jgi:hypothetical protein
MTARVMIDADGLSPEYLLIIVAAPTGVVYEHQCDGTTCDQRSQEGFLVQVGEEGSPGVIYDWFWKHFRGTGMTAAGWSDLLVDELELVIAGIPCWHIDSHGRDERGFLKLDRARIDECVEAWIPVLSPYGPAILVLNNSD